jgi:hypothetical protein
MGFERRGTMVPASTLILISFIVGFLTDRMWSTRHSIAIATIRFAMAV